MSEISHDGPNARYSSGETIQEQPTAERPGWFDRLTHFYERPLGKLTTGIVTMLALASALPGRETRAHEQRVTHSANIVTDATGRLDLRVEDGDTVATLHLTDWEDTTAFSSEAGELPIEPNALLESMITKNNPLTDDLGLTPPEIKNESLFNQWVEDQSQRKDLLALLGTDPDSTKNPRQLVDLAASIVMANVDYHFGSIASNNYDKPMDENLMEGRNLQCEGYSAATLAVFNELKKLHPDVLKNTYMTTQSGIMEGHMWGFVVQIESSHEASVAFIDATADDPSYSETEPEIQLGFVELIEGLFDARIIDDKVFRALVEQYQQKQGLTEREQEELQNDELYLIGRANGR